MNCFSIKIGHSPYLLRAFILCICLLPGVLLRAASPPGWSVDPTAYEFNMNMTIQLQYNGVPNHSANNLVAAFVGSELRGVAAPTFISGDAYYFLTIYSDQYAGETVHFRAYYAAGDAVYSTTDRVSFVHNGSIGHAVAFCDQHRPGAGFPA